MSIPRSKFDGLFYCVVEAQNIDMPALNGENVGVFAKFIVKADNEGCVREKLNDFAIELGVKVVSINDLISMNEYNEKWEIDKEIKNILKYIKDDNDISYGNFYTYGRSIN